MFRSRKRTTIPKDSKKPRSKKPTWDAKAKALLIASVAQSKNAEEIIIYQVGELTSLADFFVICSAESEPQIRAIVDGVHESLSKKGSHPLGIEGREASFWVLVDYSDVILHIFKKEAREFYSLDRLWGDAPQLPLSSSELEGPPSEKRKKGRVR